MSKKPPKRLSAEREKITLRVTKDASRKLRETACRLDISQAKVFEVLLRKHADALQVRVE